MRRALDPGARRNAKFGSRGVFVLSFGEANTHAHALRTGRVAHRVRMCAGSLSTALHSCVEASLAYVDVRLCWFLAAPSTRTSPLQQDY